MLSVRERRPVWYGNTPPTLSLRALAGLYGSLAALRRRAYQGGWLKATRLPVPVIVVGNISVGGVGKTPLTLALIEELRLRGFAPGVISRGYGGNTRGPVLLDSRSTPSVVGDEPVLIAGRSGAPVAVGRDRIAAARLLLSSVQADVLIADDGLQHYRLARDVEICVIDGERRFGNARLLPAGPLREPLARLHSVDFRVCNGGTPQAGEFAMILQGDIAVAVSDHSISRPLGKFRSAPVHAVAGIGHPARFFAELRAAGLQVIEHPFTDHHPFRATDLDFGDRLPVLMTEKDAVKCQAFADTRYWYLPVRAALPTEFFDAVAARLRTGIAKGQVSTGGD